VRKHEDLASRTPLVTYQKVGRELSALLRTMAAALGPHPDSKPRHAILIRSILRGMRANDAQVLLSDGCFAEEMHGINRTIAEVVINGAYLQIAPETELDKYQRYDVSAAARTIQRMNSSMPQTHRLSADDSNAVRQLLTGAAMDDGWSSLTVMQRAREVDKFCGVELMTPMVLFVYNHGHSHIHGTASSIESVSSWMINGANENDPDRLRATTAALCGAYNCLFNLVAFVQGGCQVGFKDEIERLKQRLEDLSSD
jgi:hypothetical protein